MEKYLSFIIFFLALDFCLLVSWRLLMGLGGSHGVLLCFPAFVSHSFSILRMQASLASTYPGARVAMWAPYCPCVFEVDPAVRPTRQCNFKGCLTGGRVQVCKRWVKEWVGEVWAEGWFH